jgi:hypothetical protein
MAETPPYERDLDGIFLKVLLEWDLEYLRGLAQRLDDGDVSPEQVRLEMAPRIEALQAAGLLGGDDDA